MQVTSPHQGVTLNESALPEILARTESVKSSLFISEVHLLLSQLGYLSWISLRLSLCHFLSLSVFLDA